MAPGTFRQIVRDMLRRGYAVRFQAAGTSMVPTIADGQTLVAEPIDAEEARVGDVVLCEVGARLLAHRVVRKHQVRSDGREVLVFHVRGDAAGAGVDRIDGRRVLGRIQSVEGEGGFRAVRPMVLSRRARLVAVCVVRAHGSGLGCVVYRLACTLKRLFDAPVSIG